MTDTNQANQVLQGDCLELMSNKPSKEKKMSSFQKDLEHLINRYSLEGGSNTPDFILAEYLDTCLVVYNHAIEARDNWYGFQPNKYLFTEVDDIELNSNKKKGE